MDLSLSVSFVWPVWMSICPTNFVAPVAFCKHTCSHKLCKEKSSSPSWPQVWPNVQLCAPRTIIAVVDLVSAFALTKVARKRVSLQNRPHRRHTKTKLLPSRFDWIKFDMINNFPFWRPYWICFPWKFSQLSCSFMWFFRYESNMKDLWHSLQ